MAKAMAKRRENAARLAVIRNGEQPSEAMPIPEYVPPEITAIEQPSAPVDTVDTTVEQPTGADAAVVTVENNSPQRHQQFASNIGAQALPEAMLTVVKVMRSTRAPAQVRLNAATWLLETGGIGPAKATAGGAAPRDASEMDRHDLQAFVAAGLRALSMRRSAAGASDASVIDVTPRALPTT